MTEPETYLDVEVIRNEFLTADDNRRLIMIQQGDLRFFPDLAPLAIETLARR